MSQRYSKLPKVAQTFLAESTILKRETVLSAFHEWMDTWKLSLANLRPSHIQSFLYAPRGKTIAPSTRYQYHSVLVRYLTWLHPKGVLSFDLKCLRSRRTRQQEPMPEPAASYVQTLEHNHKKGSINGHRVVLRRFHLFLDSHSIKLETLERQHLSMWLKHLNDAKLAPKTVNLHIIFVRLYLRWLFERDTIASYPDELIRVYDMVKEPKYLPRPLSPIADKELQRRLEEAGDIYSLGLLLMRKTGIRNGELRSLENNCLRHDHNGNIFLKVPLGKLDNERLVPIDRSTEKLIERLKKDDTVAEKRFLIETESGSKTRYQSYVVALEKASNGLDTNGRMGTHRLRHTYATALLNSGMSLVGLMKLLGHNDHRMTLRYADVTQETVGKEYFEALERMECRYAEVLNTGLSDEIGVNPYKMLEDVTHCLATMAANDDRFKSIARAMIKRIKRIQKDLKEHLHSQSVDHR